MKKKHYSFLDQRRTDFDVDYEEFCKSTSELHVSEILQTRSHRSGNRWAHLCFILLYWRYDPVWAILGDFICIQKFRSLFVHIFSHWSSRTSWRVSWIAPLKKFKIQRELWLCWRDLTGNPFFYTSFHAVLYSSNQVFAQSGPQHSKLLVLFLTS